MAPSEPRYATWGELWDATVHADPDPLPLDVTVYPPHKRERYMAMHIHGLGWTDTRCYRFGRDKRARSEAYGRRMVIDYIAVRFGIPVETVRNDGPEIRFTWSPLTWEQFASKEDIT